MSSTLVVPSLPPPPTFFHEAPSIGTTPLGTPLIGTPSDTSTLSPQNSPKQEFADFGYGLSHSTLTQFTRDTEADILIANPYYNHSLYKFFAEQNKARSHSLDVAAHFFDSITYVPTTYEYPGTNLGISLFDNEYLGVQYQPQPQQPQQQQQQQQQQLQLQDLDQKIYQSYDYCQESDAILDPQQYPQQYQCDQSLHASSDPFMSSGISRKRKSFELGGSYFDMLQPRSKRDCLLGNERTSQLSESDQVDKLGLGILKRDGM